MTTSTSIASKLPSKTAVTGHLRRAQGRLSRAFEGDEPSDVFVQASVLALGAAVALRLLRTSVIGSIVGRVAPLAVFAGVYQRSLAKSRR